MPPVLSNTPTTNDDTHHVLLVVWYIYTPQSVFTTSMAIKMTFVKDTEKRRATRRNKTNPSRRRRPRRGTQADAGRRIRQASSQAGRGSSNSKKPRANGARAARASSKLQRITRWPRRGVRDDVTDAGWVTGPAAGQARRGGAGPS